MNNARKNFFVNYLNTYAELFVFAALFSEIIGWSQRQVMRVLQGNQLSGHGAPFETCQAKGRLGIKSDAKSHIFSYLQRSRADRSIPWMHIRGRGPLLRDLSNGSPAVR